MARNSVVLAYPIIKSRKTRKKTPNLITVKMALAQGRLVNTQSKTVAIDNRAVAVKECVPKHADSFPATLLSVCEDCRST